MKSEVPTCTILCAHILAKQFLGFILDLFVSVLAIVSFMLISHMIVRLN